MTHLTLTLRRAAIILVCALVPPMVAGRGWWFIGRTFSDLSRPFEVMGLFATVAVFLYWYGAYRHRGDDRGERILTRLVVGGIVLHYVYVMVNYADPSWDYRCYDDAANNVVKGVDPYDDTNYLYPPLLAQVLAWINAAVRSTPLFAYQQTSSWWIVFYFYQVLQLALVFVVAEQCFALGRRLRIPLAYVAILTVVLFVASAPMFRTVRFNQANLIVLVAILYSLIHLDRRPWVCGVLMAVAVFVKPQGVLFPLVWLLIGFRAAALSFVVASGVLVLVQAGFGTDWTLWAQFVDSIGKIPKYNDYFRNQSLFSFFSNLTKTFGLHLDKPTLMVGVRVCYAGILAWFVYRYVDREKRFKAQLSGIPRDEHGRFALLTRTGAHTVDVVLLALLGSPLVWEHHYVLLLPAALWLFALTKGRIPVLALVGLVLVFVPSTFDVWLLSYHRLAGTILLAVALSPARLHAMADVSRRRRFPAPAAWAGAE
jgi:hypothetical protein